MNLHFWRSDSMDISYTPQANLAFIIDTTATIDSYELAVVCVVYCLWVIILIFTPFPKYKKQKPIQNCGKIQAATLNTPKDGMRLPGETISHLRSPKPCIRVYPNKTTTYEVASNTTPAYDGK